MEKYKLQLQVQAQQVQAQQVQLQQAQNLAESQQEVLRRKNADFAVRQLISQTPMPVQNQPMQNQPQQSQMMQPNKINNQTQNNTQYNMQRNPSIQPNVQPSPIPTQIQSTQQQKPVQMTNEQKLLMLAQKYNVQGMKF